MEKEMICCPKTGSSAALGIRNSSQTISKTTKPKIRIIHIFAPEIIKTDAADFRELVQRLTGKPTADARETMTNRDQTRMFASNKKMRAGFVHAERVKEEEEEDIWRSANSGAGFLGEFDGFMHELNHFHLLEGLNY